MSWGKTTAEYSVILKSYRQKCYIWTHTSVDFTLGIAAAGAIGKSMGATEASAKPEGNKNQTRSWWHLLVEWRSDEECKSWVTFALSHLSREIGRNGMCLRIISIFLSYLKKVIQKRTISFFQTTWQRQWRGGECARGKGGGGTQKQNAVQLFAYNYTVLERWRHKNKKIEIMG